MMPAISLWQPWASLWLTTPRLKLDETRHWRFPARLIGQRVLVHAAKHAVEVYDDGLDAICRDRFGADYRRTLPRGGFVGSIVLANCRPMDGNHPDLLYGAGTGANFMCGKWAVGRFAWRGVDPVTFPALIPARGQQGWWSAELPETA